MRWPARIVALAAGAWLCTSNPAVAQPFTYRGFVDVRAVAFPQDAPTDTQNLTVELLAREEGFFKPVSWLQFAGGVDVRANNHDEVEASWSVDVTDRTARRPAISVRRLTATFSRGGLTIDVGKQFIRWGKTDILTPTDRFAPRDFLNVIDADFLAVRAIRAVAELGSTTIDAAWVPYFTPSRLPLAGQRWTGPPPSTQYPERAQAGVRWGYVGSGFEFSLSFFDGFNHLPTLSVGDVALQTLRLEYPGIRAYGGDVAIPTRWFTIKGEAAMFTSGSAGADEYLLYVVQVERPSGEWTFLGGYAGEHVTNRRALAGFAPDRGLTESFIGRAAYTFDANRSAAVEAALRRNADGVYVKGELSRGYGAHWRATISGALIGGRSDDFLGQYRRNSHGGISVRYSF